RPAPLMPDPLGAFAADLRHIAVRAAGSVELVGWYAPVPVSLLADAGAAVASLAREAQRLGVLAHGAPSPLGRALLDGGDRLDAAAGGASLPQPLAYLVTDVARRHGAVRVRAVGSVVRCADEALAAELAGMKSLGLAALAPTVLASGRPPAETLAALRAA